jgi:hypothetical protein
MDINKIFKIGLLVLGFGFLAYLYCPHTNQVGRYTYHETPDTIYAFDTITGLRYGCKNRYEDEVSIIDIIQTAKIAVEDKEYFEKLRKKTD